MRAKDWAWNAKCKLLAWEMRTNCQRRLRGGSQRREEENQERVGSWKPRKESVLRRKE